MKLRNPRIFATLTAAGLLATSGFLSAQTVVQETTATTSLGTVSEFSPETIVIRSEAAPEPLRYRYTKTTTYVDETGAPVSIETVKSGLPVTVHYTRVGGDLVASKVVVRRAAPVVEQRKTTTTTTTTSSKKDKKD